jgi:type III secretion protein Q
MSALSLRKVGATDALLSRRLGAGVSLTFSTQGTTGELSLRPLPGNSVADHPVTWFASAAGPIGLSDAEAVLSILGELPVSLAGDHQPWYWQVINQRLRAPIAELLCPLEPLSDITALPAAVMTCRIQVLWGDQSLNGLMRAEARTLLRLLDAAPWVAHRQALDEQWPISQPLELGQLSLTLAELASLQPGDVLLAPLSHFDSDGNGRLQLGGRQWAVQTDRHERQLYLRFSHEESLEHGQ